MSAFRRQFVFALLIAPSFLLAAGLGRLGVAEDLAAAAMVVPALAIFLWNRAQGEDRFEGLAAPALTLFVSLSLYGFTIGKPSTVFEIGHLVGMVGAFLSLGWALWFLLFLGDPRKRVIDK